MNIRDLLRDNDQRLQEINERADGELGDLLERHHRLHAGFLVDPKGTAERMLAESEAVLREMAGLPPEDEGDGDGQVDAE